MKYAVESYVPPLGLGELSEKVGRVRAATAELRREGTPIRYLRSLFLRGDEICFLFFESPSEETVVEAARRAEVAFERVVEIEIVPARAHRRGP